MIGLQCLIKWFQVNTLGKSPATPHILKMYSAGKAQMKASAVYTSVQFHLLILRGRKCVLSIVFTSLVSCTLWSSTYLIISLILLFSDYDFKFYT